MPKMLFSMSFLCRIPTKFFQPPVDHLVKRKSDLSVFPCSQRLSEVRCAEPVSSSFLTRSFNITFFLLLIGILASSISCCTMRQQGQTLSMMNWTRSSVERRKYCQLSLTNNGRQFITPSAHLCRVELTCCDNRHAVAKFSKFIVWDKILDRSALILRYPNFLTTQGAWASQRKPPRQKSASSVQPFR